MQELMDAGQIYNNNISQLRSKLMVHNSSQVTKRYRSALRNLRCMHPGLKGWIKRLRTGVLRLRFGGTGAKKWMQMARRQELDGIPYLTPYYVIIINVRMSFIRKMV